MDLSQPVLKSYEREFAAYDIDLVKWAAPKPHGISGCFRIRDEEEFLSPSVLSHLPWLDEVVIVLNKSNLATYQVAKDLQVTYPEKVAIYTYPFELHQIDTQGHYLSDEASVYTLMHYTNWALSKCRYSWIAKIEGDVVALSSFQKIRDEVDKNPTDLMYFGRLGLNIAGSNRNMIPTGDRVRNAGWDEGVFNNNPYWHCYRYGKWESMNLHGDKPRRCLGFSFLHTKRCKKAIVDSYNRGGSPEKWTTFTRPHTKEELAKNKVQHPGEDNFCPDVLFEKTLVTDAR